MNTFVTLTCPACGGRLNVNKNSPSFTCEYCGTGHKLGEEAIEFFSRCPKCHRNDRVEKITAIENKQDPLAERFPLPERFYLDKLLPRPDLAVRQQLNSLQTSNGTENRYRTQSKLLFVFAAVLLLQACCISSAVLASDSDFYRFVLILSLIGVIPLAFFGFKNAAKAKTAREENEFEINAKRSMLEKELQTKEKEVKDKRSILKQRLTQRYNQTYYCYRDDLLFIPGEDDFASCEDYVKFMTKTLSKTS